MHSSISLLPVLALGALAQTVTQSVFFAAPSESDAFVGSVVGVGNGLTTYALACTSGGSNCYTGTTISVTEGPSTWIVQSQTAIAGETASVSEACKLQGTTSATCVEAASLNLSGTSTATTTTKTLGSSDFHYHPITITAGASKLGSSATASSSGGAAPMPTGVKVGGVLGAAVLGLAALM